VFVTFFKVFFKYSLTFFAPVACIIKIQNQHVTETNRWTDAIAKTGHLHSKLCWRPTEKTVEQKKAIEDKKSPTPHTDLSQAHVGDVVAVVVLEPVWNHRVVDSHRPIVDAPHEVVRVVQKQNVLWMIRERVVSDRSHSVDQRRCFIDWTQRSTIT